MDCPKCRSTALTSVSVPVEDRTVPGPKSATSGLEIDECPDCGGVWFDPEELDKFLDAKVRLAEAPEGAVARAAEVDAEGGGCPRCASPLSRQPARSNPHLNVDVCGRCGGTWVDGAELEQVGGDELPFAERMKAFFGDLKPPAA